MKKILFIAYIFPPFGGSHATRTIQIANLLSKKNNISVLTVNPQKENDFYDGDLLNDISPSINIFRTDFGYLHKKKYASELKNIDIKKQDKSISRRIKEYLKSKKEFFLIPDPVIDWLPIALKKGKEIIEKNNIEVIISTASPYTSHLIGYFLSKKYKVPLILDYGDPWVFEKTRVRNRIRFSIEKYIEGKILKRAKKIFVTTESTKELYEKEYNVDKGKIDIAYMGYSEEKVHKKEYVKQEKLNLIYGGTLNPIHRNPNEFIEAIHKLPINKQDKINIEIYTGDDKKIKEIVQNYNLEDTIKIKKLISYNEFMKKLGESDLLLLFGNSSSLQIPGKLFNYIGSLTKILYLKNNLEKIDPVEKILEKSGENYYSSNEKEEIEEVLLKIISDWENNCLGKNEEKNVRQFQWENTLFSLVKETENC